MKKRIAIPLAATLVAAVWLSAWAEDGSDPATGRWPQLRGHQANGIGSGAATPTRWNVETGENVAWKTPIPGLGHAAPIVWDDRIYVTTAVGAGSGKLRTGLYGDGDAADDNGPQKWRLLAIDRASGKIVYDTLAHEGKPRSKRHTKASHCNSTPATDGKSVVAILGSEGLFCFDAATGEVRWKKDLGAMDAGYFGARNVQWGFGSSPVIHDGKVVVLCDVQDDPFLALFDLEDGKELWRTARKDVPTWSTPTVVRVGDRTQILINGWHHTGAYDFATGEEIWKHDGGGDIPVPTPIVAHGMAYFTSAHGRAAPMSAIRLEAEGDITPAKLGDSSDAIVWAHARRGSYMQTPIVIGDRLLGCTDSGILTCFDAKTGAVKFRDRIGSRQGFTASPVSDGRHVYYSAEDGQVVVIAPGDALSVVAKNTLGEPCLATPAVADGTIYFRTARSLIAVRKTDAAPKADGRKAY